eukprot:TRINITY_DN29850_c0_g1_i2.p1 TRINITY_DN29850_c0_g1~~TRINITY_DN29850_c0_g1_i2.p1  ORF type:complete len:195 (-),score=38.48 TRINITY_DN29850_c0_g1_i2:192-776(-)
MLVFAFSAHSTFPEHRSSLANPQHFPRVIGLTYLVLSVWKSAFGIVAWIAYGDLTKEVITANLPTVPSKITNAAIALNTWLSLPLVVVIFFRILDALRGAKSTKMVAWTQRTLGLVFCAAVAGVVPHFALLLGLFGALTGTLLTFLFPVIFYLKLGGERLGMGRKIGAWVVMVFGVVGGGWSTYSAVKALIQKM